MSVFCPTIKFFSLDNLMFENQKPVEIFPLFYGHLDETG